jgi:hypothetical protein
MTDLEWLTFAIDEAKRFGHTEKAAALERMKESLYGADIRSALIDARDSLEYVQRTHPEATGWGVRQERITKITAVVNKFWPS